MKIEKLIKVLAEAAHHFPGVDVQCTWEGTEREIAGVYLSKGGILLIDSDSNMYLEYKMPRHMQPFYKDEDAI